MGNSIRNKTLILSVLATTLLAVAVLGLAIAFAPVSGGVKNAVKVDDNKLPAQPATQPTDSGQNLVNGLHNPTPAARVSPPVGRPNPPTVSQHHPLNPGIRAGATFINIGTAFDFGDVKCDDFDVANLYHFLTTVRWTAHPERSAEFVRGVTDVVLRRDRDTRLCAACILEDAAWRVEHKVMELRFGNRVSEWDDKARRDFAAACHANAVRLGLPPGWHDPSQQVVINVRIATPNSPNPLRPGEPVPRSSEAPVVDGRSTTAPGLTRMPTERERAYERIWKRMGDAGIHYDGTDGTRENRIGNAILAEATELEKEEFFLGPYGSTHRAMLEQLNLRDNLVHQLSRYGVSPALNYPAAFFKRAEEIFANPNTPLFVLVQGRWHMHHIRGELYDSRGVRLPQLNPWPSSRFSRDGKQAFVHCLDMLDTNPRLLKMGKKALERPLLLESDPKRVTDP
jgi:hypothetical protein